MTLTDFIFGPTDIKRKIKLDSLMANGFSQEEAEGLQVISGSKSKARFFSFAAGVGGILFFFRMINKHHNTPLFFKNKLLSYSSIGIAAIGLNYYIYGNRQGANTPITNFYTNNLLISNRQSIVRNLQLFNRKFTEEEVEQMLFNKDLMEYII